MICVCNNIPNGYLSLSCTSVRERKPPVHILQSRQTYKRIGNLGHYFTTTTDDDRRG